MLTFFKGFRDYYYELVDEGYKVHIPTCAQLENERLKVDETNEGQNIIDFEKDFELTKKSNPKQLTTIQTSKSRLVTKVNTNSNI